MTDWTKRDSADPLKVLERRESYTCRGCHHLSSLWSMPICTKNNDVAKKRCKHFKEQQ